MWTASADSRVRRALRVKWNDTMVEPKMKWQQGAKMTVGVEVVKDCSTVIVESVAFRQRCSTQRN